MIPLQRFNALPDDDAIALLTPCVAIPSWVTTLVQARPFADRRMLFARAADAAQAWGEEELTLALSAHPRIGEKPAGQQAHAALSRLEQSSVNDRDAALAQALKTGNAQYEARFGRVFLIRARGRSGEEILQALRQRLDNTAAQEVQAALTQLAEITLLRLEGIISE